ncbi:hypothetical protein ACFGY2_11620 [Pasteurella multocida]
MKNEIQGYEIILEDKGQDFTRFRTDKNGVIIEAIPFQTDVWKGGMIPIKQQKLGEYCMIHHSPHIEFGFLKYKVIGINLL